MLFFIVMLRSWSKAPSPVRKKGYIRGRETFFGSTALYRKRPNEQHHNWRGDGFAEKSQGFSKETA
jgi:hypothetical protein